MRTSSLFEAIWTLRQLFLHLLPYVVAQKQQLRQEWAQRPCFSVRKNKKQKTNDPKTQRPQRYASFESFDDITVS